MERLRVARRHASHLLWVVGAGTALVTVGFLAIGYLRCRDQELAQQLAIHHFERSSWFALHAERYEAFDPELTRGFRESAVWHARRAREFQRMHPAEVAQEAARDLEHDIADGRLMERALRCDAVLKERADMTLREGGRPPEGP